MGVVQAAVSHASRFRCTRPGSCELDSSRLSEPLAPVLAHVLDDRNQGAPLLRQRVLHARRNLRERPPLDDAVLLECAEAEGKRAGADALQRALELAEARATIGQIPD